MVKIKDGKEANIAIHSISITSDSAGVVQAYWPGTAKRLIGIIFVFVFVFSELIINLSLSDNLT